MNSNSSKKYLGKNLTNIIRVMPNIGFAASSDRIAITPEKLGATIEQMSHEFPTICSLVFNGLFISIVMDHSFILSEHINLYHLNTYIKYQLTRLPWYH